MTQVYQDCYDTVYRYFTKSSPLPTYFTVPDRSLLIYTDTFCNAVDCRFGLALEVQRWTRARSECLPGDPKIYLRHYPKMKRIPPPLVICPEPIIPNWRNIFDHKTKHEIPTTVKLLPYSEIKYGTLRSHRRKRQRDRYRLNI